MRRYIVTGAPGAGKTTLLGALRARGHDVVDEAATDVITRGHPQDAGFLDAIVALQQERQLRPSDSAVQLYDRSPVCTLALAHYGGSAVSRFLAAEVARPGVYEPRVFFVRLLGFITPTPVRRISFADTVRFETIHEQVYRAQGYDLVDVPPGAVDERADLVENYLRRWRDR
jgi:predicted ATPase